MKCPKCGFVSFDFLEKCKKCDTPFPKTKEAKAGWSLFEKIKEKVAATVGKIEPKKEEPLPEKEETAADETLAANQKKDKAAAENSEETQFDKQFENLFGDDKKAQSNENDIIKITAVDVYSQRKEKDAKGDANSEYDASFLKVTNSSEEEVDELIQEVIPDNEEETEESKESKDAKTDENNKADEDDVLQFEVIKEKDGGKK